jgi:hypothetical protein
MGTTAPNGQYVVLVQLPEIIVNPVPFENEPGGESV